MSLTESFRADLDRLARAEQWDAWRETRLIFADHLAESASPEEGLARAEWQPKWVKHQECVYCAGTGAAPFGDCDCPCCVGKGCKGKGAVPYLWLFHVPIAQRKPLVGAHNQETLLCFAPWTLRLIRLAGPMAGWTEDRYVAHFSWVPWRERMQGWKADARKSVPRGFLDLFAQPEKRPERMLFDGLTVEAR